MRYLTNDKYEFDLPTEAQWEYACRCGTSTSTYKGNVWSAILNSIAWWYGNSALNGVSQPHPVGLKEPNDWDMYDMIGNVIEWCLDYYQPNLGTSAVIEPVGPDSDDATGDKANTRRVLKGGEYSGNYGTSNAQEYRAARRDRVDTYWQNPWMGFRLWAPAMAIRQ